MKLTILLLNLLVLLSVPVVALDPEKALTQYSHDIWRMEHGLPSNSINAIVQTDDGYLWLGSSVGLIRFDGVRFKVFDSRNTPGLGEDIISSLCQSRDGTLWMGTGGGGIATFRDGKFKSYKGHEGLSHDFVTSVVESRDGQIWIGTGGGGLSRFKDGRFSSYVLNENHVHIAYNDRFGNLWVGTRGGLSLLKDGVFTNYTTQNGLGSNIVYSIIQDSSGNLWVGTSDGLTCFREGKFKNFTIRDGLPGGSITSLLEDRDGNLWIGTSRGGLARFRNNKESSFDVADNRSGEEAILALYEDREGSIWIGTTEGLRRIKEGKFTTYTTTEGLTSNYVKSVRQSKDGSLWIGTHDSGIVRIKDGRFTSYNRSNGFPGNTIETIFESRDGSLWFGLNGAAVRLKDGVFTTFPENPNHRVSIITEDRDGIILGVMRQMGAYAQLMRVEGNSIKPYEISLPPIRYIFYSYTDQAGSLWLGTTDGLVKISNGKTQVFTSRNGLAGDEVTSIYDDRKGSLWLTSRKGVTRMQDKRFTIYNSACGLHDDAVWGIIEDNLGNLWISSKKGIFTVSRRELDDYARGTVKRINSVSYGIADGMKSVECRGGNQPSVWKAQDGRLWFPTTKGLAVIHPAFLRTNKVIPSVVIEEVLVDSLPVETGKHLTLPPGRGELEFHFTALSLLAPEKVQIRYKLEGFDTDWVEAGRRRVAHYTNLPPGSYNFKVIACNNDRIWNEEGTALAFELKPHLHQTYWIYLLGALLFSALGWLIYRQRMKQMRMRFTAVMDERNRIAREMHDSMSQGFVGVLAQLNALRSALAGSSQVGLTHLDMATNMVRHSLNEARRFIYELRSPALEGNTLSTAILETGKSLLVGIDFDVQVRGTPQKLPETIEMQLLRITQEALANAAKHSGANRVEVDLIYDPRQVTVQISDDGCGFDTSTNYSAHQGHFGLLGMQERVAQIDGQLMINSAPQIGTTIIATIPFN